MADKVELHILEQLQAQSRRLMCIDFMMQTFDFGALPCDTPDGSDLDMFLRKLRGYLLELHDAEVLAFRRYVMQFEPI